MRISIVGAGAIGSLLTHILNRAGVEPILVRRSPDRGAPTRILVPGGYEAMLRYKGAVFNDDEWLHSEVVFIATKAYDAVEVIKRASGSRDIELVIVTQNGLGSFEEGVERLGPGRMAQLVLNHGAALIDRLICIWAGGGRSYLGMRRGYSNRYLNTIASLLRDLDVAVVDDIEPYRWLKLAVNAVINPITAILEVRNKAIVEEDHLRSLAYKACTEIKRISEARGIELPRDPCSEVLEVAIKTGDNISSMLSDLTRCRETEVEFINGAIARTARELGIEAPINDTLYAMVKAKEKLKCSQPTRHRTP